ncbi:MAG TPA: transcription antitermination factor NusB [Bryobacteraceae bacterium]|nr:transcription antitermination factor NusB [Bryobacteraceae bacterium]
MSCKAGAPAKGLAPAPRYIQTVSPARVLAFEILTAVERGGYASDLLAARAAPLDTRDAGLASEIVLGVLRYRAQLDYLIEHYSGKPAARLDDAVRQALRMGIYQLRYLERVPPHAAVSESVELIKRARKRSAAGFANAVLRKVDRAPVLWPSADVELSHPAWLLERWERQYGAEMAAAIARANLRVPENYVNPATGRVQDIGSQSIVPLLVLEAGQTFLDLCAAPGNKTAQALAAGVRGVACDIHLHRLTGLKALGVDLVVLDGTRPLPFRRRFDRVLIDAPCSGTGTLAHNPEIKWRLEPEDLPDLQARQVALLEQGRRALAPGGVLVYSTCSLEREENEDVVGTVAGEMVVETMQRLPGREAGDGFFAAVIRAREG